jgi:hypothetical protein
MRPCPVVFGFICLCLWFAPRANSQTASPRIGNFIYFLHEAEKDHAWNLRFTGTVSEKSAVNIVLLSPIVNGLRDSEKERGGIPLYTAGSNQKYLSRVPVPTGVYTEEKPFIVTVPEDGMYGYYQLLILGSDDPQFMKPTSDLKLETPNAQPSIEGQNYYFREPSDREWHLTFIGEVSSRAGIYLIIHDANGKAIYHGELPCGSYTDEKPLVITVPKDGVRGDYRMVMLGNSATIFGLRRPFSDLPFEVVGGTDFYMGSPWPTPAFFRAPKDVKQMAIGGYKAHVRVLREDGEVICDGRVTGKSLEQMESAQRARLEEHFNKWYFVDEFDIEPEQLYVLDSNAGVHTMPAINVAVDPRLLFTPDPRLTDVKWWELVKP